MGRVLSVSEATGDLLLSLLTDVMLRHDDIDNDGGNDKTEAALVVELGRALTAPDEMEVAMRLAEELIEEGGRADTPLLPLLLLAKDDIEKIVAGEVEELLETLAEDVAVVIEITGAEVERETPALEVEGKRGVAVRP